MLPERSISALVTTAWSSTCATWSNPIAFGDAAEVDADAVTDEMNRAEILVEAKLVVAGPDECLVDFFLAWNARVAAEKTPQTNQRLYRDVEGTGTFTVDPLCERDDLGHLGLNLDFVRVRLRG